MATRLSILAGAFSAVLAAICPVLAQSRAIDDAHAALIAADYKKALQLAAPLADAGDSSAQHLIGYIYEKGLGVRADIGAALRYYGDAAVAGNTDAQLALGEIALGGDVAYADFERAAGWFRLAAARGDARAQTRLGVMYAEGVGVARDRFTAAAFFAKAAAKGDIDGSFYLGVAFLNGDGVPQNYPQSEKFFLQAAGGGHAEAAYHLALMYDSPALGAPDPKRAVLAMEAAARAGFAPAFAGMGLFVHRGDAEGVAADWFEKGAAAGDPRAAFLYAVALVKGDGREKNIPAALAIAEKLMASPAASADVRANAEKLRKDIARLTPGPLTLRD